MQQHPSILTLGRSSTIWRAFQLKRYRWHTEKMLRNTSNLIGSVERMQQMWCTSLNPHQMCLCRRRLSRKKGPQQQQACHLSFESEYVYEFLDKFRYPACTQSADWSQKVFCFWFKPTINMPGFCLEYTASLNAISILGLPITPLLSLSFFLSVALPECIYFGEL